MKQTVTKTRAATAVPPLQIIAGTQIKVKTKPRGPKTDCERDMEEKARAHPDATLISLCVEYGALTSGQQQAFRIDPTDSLFASQLDGRLMRRATALLEEAGKIAAVTPDGLRAKAGVVHWLVNQDLAPTELVELVFIESLADDIANFHRGMPNGSHEKPFRTDAEAAGVVRREADEAVRASA
jgi:hypothetical protein